MTGTIEVRRLQRFSGAPLQCAVLLNGELIAKVFADEVISKAVSAGQHNLQARLGFYLSPPFVVSVQEGETVKVEFALPKAHELGRIFLGPLTGKYFQRRLQN